MPLDSSWEWELLYYTGTVILGMSPIVFWKSTPRKLNILVKTYFELNDSGGGKSGKAETSSQRKGFIDQVF